MNTDITKFLDRFNIKVIGSKQGYRANFKRFFTDPHEADSVVDGRFWNPDSDLAATYIYTEPEKVYVVEIGENSMQHLSDMTDHWAGRTGESASRAARDILERDWQAKNLRKKYPAVQAAWEQYSLMLHLSSNGNAVDND